MAVLTKCRRSGPLPGWALLTAAVGAPVGGGEGGLAVGLWQGWRESELAWDVAGGSSGASSQYEGIGAWTTRLGLRLTLDGLAMRVQGDYGLVTTGSSRDQVIAGDGSVSEQVDADSDAGWTSALTVGLGWRVQLGERFRLLPEAGWARSEQHLVQRDGVRSIPDGAALAGLDNRFTARWSGPWLALGGSWLTGVGGLVVQARVQAQALRYHANGDLNLRDDLDHPVSFSQDADGYGVGAAVALAWAINATWSCALAVEHERLRAGDGSDTLHLADGTTVASDLVEAELRSTAVMIGVSARF